MRISIKVSAVLAASVALLIASAIEVSAQRRHAVVIEAKVEKGKCDYEIRNGDGALLANQDKFLMRANGFLIVMSDTVQATFEVKDDTTKGHPGVRGKRKASVAKGNSDVLRVRKEKKKDLGSVHLVEIHCCKETAANGECQAWERADDLSEADVEVDRLNRASLVPFREILHWLFGEGEPPTGPPKPGGPDMDVHP